jgi:hypothetical protein
MGRSYDATHRTSRPYERPMGATDIPRIRIAQMHRGHGPLLLRDADFTDVGSHRPRRS